ncbi:MAG: divalent-cation tolerance protein CutA [Sandaracinaceae bacterium]
MDTDAILVLTTAPDPEVATQLARGLVDAKLAACVNVIGGMTSVYRWRGEVHEDAEVQLLVKTRDALLPAIETWLDTHHPYDVPELLALPVSDGSSGYLTWLAEQTELGS